MKRRRGRIKRSETLKQCFLFISPEVQSGAAAQIGPQRGGDENQTCRRKEETWRDGGEEGEEEEERRWRGGEGSISAGLIPASLPSGAMSFPDRSSPVSFPEQQQPCRQEVSAEASRRGFILGRVENLRR